MSNWTKLADLKQSITTKVLAVRPLRRPYISMDEAIYDYHVGHDLVVTDQSSPLNGCTVTVCDRDQLKRVYGISHLHIRFNPGVAPAEVAL